MLPGQADQMVNTGRYDKEQNFYQNSLSLAESTISPYSDGGSNIGDPGHTTLNKIETRTHPDTGLQHLFDKGKLSLVGSLSTSRGVLITANEIMNYSVLHTG